MNTATVETCIVTVHYGDPEVTKRCLNALAQLTVPAYIVVSNNDTEACADILRQHIRSLSDAIRAEVVQNAENRGFAAGCNTGIRRAQTLCADYVWLLNNDTEARPDALAALLRCAGKHPRAVIGSTVVEMERPDVIQVAGGFKYNPWTTVIRPAYAGNRLSDTPRLEIPPFDYIYGASIFVSTKLLAEVGFLNEIYQLYYEELDFCLKARYVGAELIWCRDSIVKHTGGAPLRSPKDTQGQSPLAAYHESRSTIIYTRRHHSRKLAMVLLVRAAGKAVCLFYRKEWRLFKPTFHGLLDGMQLPLHKR